MPKDAATTMLFSVGAKLLQKYSRSALLMPVKMPESG